jgi:hypothetical protein
MLIQQSISGEGKRVVPRPGESGPRHPGPGKGNLHTHTILSHISTSPELSLILAYLKFPERQDPEKKKN